MLRRSSGHLLLLTAGSRAKCPSSENPPLFPGASFATSRGPYLCLANSSLDISSTTNDNARKTRTRRSSGNLRRLNYCTKTVFSAR